MGNGRFINGTLNFVVSADFALSAAEKTVIQTTIRNASDFLYNATGGQVQFGDVYMTDGSSGLVDADVVFQQAGTLSGGSRGKFGTPNSWVKITPIDRFSGRVLAHEMSHHIWNLGDEYAGQQYFILIDKSAPAPNAKTIPILNGPVANSLVNQLVNVRFLVADDVRKTIVSNTSTQIVVDVDYPDLPTNSSSDRAWLQDTHMTCGHPSVTGVSFCIMEDYSAGVTEFCQQNNHNSIQPTDQQLLHNESCWETIIGTPGFTSLTVPAASPAAPPAAVNFIDILKENRFAIAFDHSGSMSGDKLAYAKEGVKYWIDNCMLVSDFLSIIAYNANNNILLPMVQANAAPNMATVESDVDMIAASGQTNIRDAIREGVTQITSIPNRAVSQAVIVLTDGKHNRPAGTSLTEALHDLVDNGVKAVTIAIGDGNGVDASDLDDVAFESGGIMMLVGLRNPIDIETALIEASLYLSGALADSSSFDFVPAPTSYRKAKSLTDQIYKRDKLPPFKDVMRALGIRNRKAGTAGAFRPYHDLFRIADVYIECKCERVNFSINYNLQVDFDLFLMDPSGASVEPNGGSVRKVGNRSTHKIMTVQKPRQGIWRVVIYARRLLGSQATTVNLTVGAENRRLVITGGCTKSIYKTTEKAKIFARASWESGLTELKVRAFARSHLGDSFTADLSDGGPMSDFAGEYTVEIPNLKTGQYKGIISIEGKTKNVRADAKHRLGHANATTVDSKSAAPKFARIVPFFFEIIKGR
ncbi:MAG: VWA domain-containing protein [Syntrophales bacterium]|nr:VWA domain-containing protein [Syntrophales bacterium]